MGNLFDNQDKATGESYASQVFTESFKDMTGEINRVANEKVTVWSKIVMWIYGVVHGDPYKLKKKQSSEEMIRSANAFEDVQEIFSEEKSSSMNNQELLDHTTKNFRRKK